MPFLNKEWLKILIYIDMFSASKSRIIILKIGRVYEIKVG